MSAADYKWLIVGEGEFDVKTYTKLLQYFGIPDADFAVKSVGRKSKVFRMNKWSELPENGNGEIISQKWLQTAQAKPNFMGVICIVDSDEQETLSQNYAAYSKECRSSLVDYADWEEPIQIEIDGSSIIVLDKLKGSNRELPIYGLCVPISGQGCLETDLLRAYGYPVENESSYDNFATTIKEASDKWDVDKKDWWNPCNNGKARMDKFMYSALANGFEVNRLKTKLIEEPKIITHIKNAMKLKSA